MNPRPESRPPTGFSLDSSELCEREAPVYDGIRIDMQQSPMGAFECNYGVNESWAWHEGENQVHEVES